MFNFTGSLCLQKFFGDEYYGEEEDEKPQFEDDDELEGELTEKPVLIRLKLTCAKYTFVGCTES